MNMKFYPLFPHTLKNMVHIRDINKQLKEMPMDNEFYMKAGYYSSKLFNNIKNLINPIPDTHQLEINDVDYFDDRFDRFWDVVSEEYDFIIERKKEYLNWRYLDTRTGNFNVRVIVEDTQIIGFSVLRINAYLKEYPIGYIVELLALPGRLDVVHVLAQDAVEFFTENNVNLINYQVINGHPYETVMENHGFLNSHINVTMFIVLNDNSVIMESIKNCTPDRVYFSYGDLDTLPVGIVES